MGRILIVEDDTNISKGLAQISKSIDNTLDILVTEYAEEALKYTNQNNIDAFFLDIQLKDYSGIKLAKSIREIDKYKLTPIVFITAVPTRELLAFKEIHCYDYIVKPFSIEDVEHVFKTIILHGIKEEAIKPILKLKQKEYSYTIQQDEIVYIEARNRKIIIVTSNDRITVSTYTLKQLVDKLTGEFVQCHKGFIINTKYVEKVDSVNNLISMRGTETDIPLGRKYKENLKGECL